MAKLVTTMGGVWKLSDAAYRRFLRAVIAGNDWDLSEIGKYLGDAVNVTDIDAEEAKYKLAFELKDRRTK